MHVGNSEYLTKQYFSLRIVMDAVDVFLVLLVLMFLAKLWMQILAFKHKVLVELLWQSSAGRVRVYCAAIHTYCIALTICLH